MFEESLGASEEKDVTAMSWQGQADRIAMSTRWRRFDVVKPSGRRLTTYRPRLILRRRETYGIC